MKSDLTSKVPKIGEIYLMKFAGNECEQTGVRPGLVFQNNLGNIYSPNIIALPLTTAIKKRGQPTHVMVFAIDTGLQRDSLILCENPERMSKSKIGRFICTLPDKYMTQVAVASLISSSAISFIDKNMLYSVWDQAVLLNDSIQSIA